MPKVEPRGKVAGHAVELAGESIEPGVSGVSLLEPLPDGIGALVLDFSRRWSGNREAPGAHQPLKLLTQLPVGDRLQELERGSVSQLVATVNKPQTLSAVSAISFTIDATRNRHIGRHFIDEPNGSTTATTEGSGEAFALFDARAAPSTATGTNTPQSQNPPQKSKKFLTATGGQFERGGPLAKTTGGRVWPSPNVTRCHIAREALNPHINQIVSA